MCFVHTLPAHGSARDLWCIPCDCGGWAPSTRAVGILFATARTTSTPGTMSKKGSKRDVRLTDEEIAAVQSVQQILCYVPRCVYQYYLKKKTAPKPQCKSTEAAIMFADVSGMPFIPDPLPARVVRAGAYCREMLILSYRVYGSKRTAGPARRERF